LRRSGRADARALRPLAAVRPRRTRSDDRRERRRERLGGKNSKLTSDYAPPAPPRGGGVHHYHFQVFALDDELAGSPEKEATLPSTFQDSTGVLSGVGRSELIEQMRGHVIAWGEIVGTQGR
jgi:phosphatidylethanolamine-binding protein (PEBP) family uncharacterized protein